MKFSFSIWFLARLFLGSIFMFAGYTKIVASTEDFQAVILEYHLFPYQFSYAIAAVMPWFEFLLGLLVVTGFLTRVSSLALGALSASFILMIGMSFLKMGVFPESCGCFGEGLHLSPAQVLWLDMLNVFLGIKLFSLQDHPWSLDRYFSAS